MLDIVVVDGYYQLQIIDLLWINEMKNPFHWEELHNPAN